MGLNGAFSGALKRVILPPFWTPTELTQWDLWRPLCLSAVKFFFGAILKTKRPKMQKKFSEHFQKENSPLRITLRKKAKENMNNLNIIANYLFSNPGARYTQITKHMCRENKKKWTKGQYCRYFTEPVSYRSRWKKCKETRYAHRLWCKTPCGGWMLTLEGYGYVRP